MGYIFAFSMLASIILSTYVYGVYSILLGSIMGFRMERLSFLFITFVREQERIKAKIGKFTLTCNLEMKMKVFDEKKDKLFCYIVAVLMILSSAGIILLMYFFKLSSFLMTTKWKHHPHFEIVLPQETDPKRYIATIYVKECSVCVLF